MAHGERPVAQVVGQHAERWIAPRRLPPLAVEVERLLLTVQRQTGRTDQGNGSVRQSGLKRRPYWVFLARQRLRVLVHRHEAAGQEAVAIDDHKVDDRQDVLMISSHSRYRSLTSKAEPFS